MNLILTLRNLIVLRPQGAVSDIVEANDYFPGGIYYEIKFGKG